jgi:hypothetical protein
MLYTGSAKVVLFYLKQGESMGTMSQEEADLPQAESKGIRLWTAKGASIARISRSIDIAVMLADIEGKPVCRQKGHVIIDCRGISEEDQQRLILALKALQGAVIPERTMAIAAMKMLRTSSQKIAKKAEKLLQQLQLGKKTSEKMLRDALKILGGLPEEAAFTYSQE